MLSARRLAQQGLLLHSEKHKHKEKKGGKEHIYSFRKENQVSERRMQNKENRPQKRIVYSHKKEKQISFSFQ